MFAVNKLSNLKREIQKTGTLGLSMHLRLFLFLVVLVVTMILGILLILLLNGNLSIGLKESEAQLINELNHTTQEISQYYSQLSVEAVDFSKNLSLSIENTLSKTGLKTTDLQNHPEILEDLLTSEYERALFSLQKSKSSGVFIVLDTTINTKLENAENSRTGLFIKNLEPNIISASAPTIVLLRGFPDIARNNSVPLHAQWRMEFDILEADYYRLPIEQAIIQKQKQNLNRLYYWSPAFKLPGTSEEIMLCSVPLIDTQGNVYGTCGLEISAMLFKLTHIPNNSAYPRTFCLFAPITNNLIHTPGAMLASDYLNQKSAFVLENLQVEKNRKYFYSYQGDSNLSFLGYHQSVQLYPKESAFSDQKWVTALLIPETDVRDAVVSINLRLIMMFAFLMSLGIIVSFFLSRYYISPITNSLALIKSNHFSETTKTKIPEIDELIDSLSIHNNELQEKPIQEQPSALINEFILNIKTLSPAERSVFNLYIQNYNAKEIASSLCLSINTIKTHSKHIYTKLNVNSKEELLLYINMVKEADHNFN